MRTRHRMPMIFSLSMMDVFCCTLGCVILLWLINQREAMLRTKAASAATHQLTESQRAFADLAVQREAVQKQLDAVQADLQAMRDQAARLQTELAASRTRADDLVKQLADQRDRAQDAEDRLSKKSTAEQQLTRMRRDDQKQIAELEKTLREREAAAELLTRQAAETADKLALADARASQYRKQAELLPEVREAAVTSDTRVKSLERELRDLRGVLETSRTESRDLTNQLSRARTASEQRFEGIALSGRRVVFLVDMSGSMELVDEKTTDPGKWPGVRDTMLRILRSLPGLEKYQVILFSDKVTHVLGQEGRWLDYDANSATKISDAISAVRPKGNTNMYAAFDAAFQYRAQGLDTIYLFSDGLPNVGEGIPANPPASMTETQRTEALSRTVRTALKTRWNAVDPRRPKVRINAVGFFYESPDVGAFLWALARENDGSFVGMSRP